MVSNARKTHPHLSFFSRDFFYFIHLLLICVPHKRPIRLLQLLLQVLIHGESDGLTRSHTHHTRGNTLVERRSTLRLEHILGNHQDTSHSRLPGRTRGTLETGLDGINGGVGEGTDSTGEQADHGRLVRGELGVAVFGLHALQERLEFRVGREVGGLVGSLSEGGQGDTAVEDAEAFFLDDGEERVWGAAVLRSVEGIGKTVVLGLQTDLDHFHGVDDGHGFRHTGGKTS